MYNPGHVVVIHREAEPELAHSLKVIEAGRAELFYIGAGALESFLELPSFRAALGGRIPVAAIFSDENEARELRGRISQLLRHGRGALGPAHVAAVEAAGPVKARALPNVSKNKI